jgi:hypothetical protein
MGLANKPFAISFNGIVTEPKLTLTKNRNTIAISNSKKRKVCFLVNDMNLNFG